MAVVEYAGARVEIKGSQITCANAEIEEAVRLMAVHDLPDGYFVSQEHAIVAMLEARGADVIERPPTPETREGRHY